MKKKFYLLILSFVIIVVPRFVYSDSKNKPSNQWYEKWCTETFKYGKYVYRAYKDVTFNIRYIPEDPKVDSWQTPKDTKALGGGDCEDGAFLFLSHLPPELEEVEIVWGLVINKESGIAKAHVWCKLVDKEDKEYVLECFTKGWNGIIPVDVVEKTEVRKSILTISNLELNCLYKIESGFESLEAFKESAGLHCVELQENDNKYVGATYSHINLAHRLKSINNEFIAMEPTFKLRHSSNTVQFTVIVEKEIHKLFRKLHGLLGRIKREGRIEIGL